MSDLTDYMNSHLPEDWTVSNLIFLDPTWQANICDGEHVAVGTGDTPEDALLIAGSKAETGQYTGRLAILDSLKRIRASEEAKIEGNGLLAALGLAKPKKPIQRRL